MSQTVIRNRIRSHLLLKNTRRFESKIDRSGGPDACWPWMGCTQSNTGYGATSVGRRDMGAHRRAWELAHGPIPAGMHVCHHCDNRICCNPAHLFLGTHNDNMADMCRKGRQARGRVIGPPRRLFGDDQIREIRMLRELGGMSMCAIGKLFGVRREHVRKIVLRQIYHYTEC